ADGSEIESKIQKYEIDSVDDCSYLPSAIQVNTLIIVGADCTKSELYKYEDPDFPLEVRGILSGSGKIGNVKIMSGGKIAPGNSPGTLTVAGIEWEEGGFFEFDFGKSSDDQIKALGTVTLGEGTLSVVVLDGANP